MIKLLEGKNAIITGARRGMGRAMVEIFATHGANIWAWARKQDDEFEKDMAEVANKYGVEIKPVYGDLGDGEAIKSVVQAIGKEKKTIDVLINNAGISINSLFQMTSVEKVKEQFSVNFYGPYLLMQLVARYMVKNASGSIINISSSAGIDANAGRAAYGSAKAALICLTKVVAEELGGKNIRVNAIAPGITDTPMIEGNMSEQVINDTIGASMLGKIGKPEDIANAALFLASDLSSYITGQVIRVDGGMV